MKKNLSKKLIGLASLVALALAIGWYVWQIADSDQLPATIVSGNGRIEATEYDIATKLAGRLLSVSAHEGDSVEAGQVLAMMDTDDLQAQLHEAQAGLRLASESRKYALAIVAQRESEQSFAQAEMRRWSELVKQGNVSQERVDQRRTDLRSADAGLNASRIQVVQAEAKIAAAEARIDRLESSIDDCALKAPIRGRVLYRLAEPGEVLAGGGKVMTVLDLSDVYMTIFLPAAESGRVLLGSEARIVLDAIPQYTIPAKVSFVAARAQFTPKAVETRAERDKLMFRVKVKIDPQLLKEHVEKVKTGVPGVAYVLLVPATDWPEQLQVRLPE